LLNRSPDERLLEYSGKRVRYALIVVDLVNRRPIEIVRDEFGFLDFDRILSGFDGGNPHPAQNVD